MDKEWDAMGLCKCKNLECPKRDICYRFKKNRVKLNDMINYEATAKQIKYIEDLCKNNGYEFYNKNINMKHAGSIIAFLAKDKVQPHYLFDYIRYE
jgi:hypothetical protein